VKNIPHDYYLRFTDPLVYERILNFHCQGNFIIHDATRHSTSLHFFESKHLEDLTGNELRLYPPSKSIISADSMTSLSSDLHRNESCDYFDKSHIDFDTVKQIVEPLTSRQHNSFKRGYPSAGALYPTEIFVCCLTDQALDWPCEERILHLLPNSCEFEAVRNSEDVTPLKISILTKDTDIGSPALAIVYTSFMPKTVFKYRYRGYRMALMEVGSMYMLTDLQVKKVGLQSRLWSAYNDTMLCKSIGINPALFLPLCVQFIG